MMWGSLASLALLLAGYLPTNRGMMSRADAATSGLTYYFQTNGGRCRSRQPSAGARAASSGSPHGGIFRSGTRGSAQFTIGAPPELDGDAFVTNVLTLLRRSAAASSAASAASGRAFPPCDSSYRCPDHEMEDAGVAVSRPSRLFSATRRAPMRPSCRVSHERPLRRCLADPMIPICPAVPVASDLRKGSS